MLVKWGLWFSSLTTASRSRFLNRMWLNALVGTIFQKKPTKPSLCHSWRKVSISAFYERETDGHFLSIYISKQSHHESQTFVICLDEYILLNPSSLILFWKVKIPMRAQHVLSIGIFRVTANSQYRIMYPLLCCSPISVSLQALQGSWAPSLRQCNC